jgi:hypothetical protein
MAGVVALLGGLFAIAHAEAPLLAQLAGACEGVRYLSSCRYSPLYDVLAGLLGLLLCGGYVLLLFRTIRRVPAPTVYCQRCDGAGWVRDIEPTHGHCPRCGHDRFAYRYFRAGPGPGFRVIVEPDVRGEALITRRDSQGRWSRLWEPVR